MAKPPVCPFCDPSIIVTNNTRICATHKGVNSVARDILRITKQENMRAIKRGLIANLTIEQVGMARWFFSIPNGTPQRSEACAFCRQAGSTGLDHWQPLSLGGGSTVSNVIPCCYVCNVMKNALTGDEFLTVMIDNWKSPIAIEAQKNIEFYWSLVNGEPHAVYEFCSKRPN